MNRVYIKTYGCQMNERDSEAVAAMLRGKGYALVDNEKEADVVLLNTCSVRDQAEQKAIGKAGHLGKRKRKDPNFIIGVMGCMAQNRGSSLLDSLPDLDLIIGTQKFHRVPDHLTNMIATMQGQGPRPSSIVDLGEEADSQNTIKSHTLDLNQRIGFDPSSTANLDTVNTSLPYFNPVTPAFTSTQYKNGLIVPSSWTSGYGAGNHKINVQLTDLWRNSESLSLTLVPEPASYAVVVAAMLTLGIARRRLKTRSHSAKIEI